MAEPLQQLNPTLTRRYREASTLADILNSDDLEQKFEEAKLRYRNNPKELERIERHYQSAKYGYQDAAQEKAYAQEISRGLGDDLDLTVPPRPMGSMRQTDWDKEQRRKWRLVRQKYKPDSEEFKELARVHRLAMVGLTPNLEVSKKTPKDEIETKLRIVREKYADDPQELKRFEEIYRLAYAGKDVPAKLYDRSRRKARETSALEDVLGAIETGDRELRGLISRKEMMDEGKKDPREFMDWMRKEYPIIQGLVDAAGLPLTGAAGLLGFAAGVPLEYARTGDLGGSVNKNLGILKQLLDTKEGLRSGGDALTLTAVSPLNALSWGGGKGWTLVAKHIHKAGKAAGLAGGELASFVDDAVKLYGSTAGSPKFLPEMQKLAAGYNVPFEALEKTMGPGLRFAGDAGLSIGPMEVASRGTMNRALGGAPAKVADAFREAAGRTPALPVELGGEHARRGLEAQGQTLKHEAGQAYLTEMDSLIQQIKAMPEGIAKERQKEIFRQNINPELPPQAEQLGFSFRRREQPLPVEPPIERWKTIQEDLPLRGVGYKPPAMPREQIGFIDERPAAGLRPELPPRELTPEQWANAKTIPPGGSPEEPEGLFKMPEQGALFEPYIPPGKWPPPKQADFGDYFANPEFARWAGEKPLPPFPPPFPERPPPPALTANEKAWAGNIVSGHIEKQLTRAAQEGVDISALSDVNPVTKKRLPKPYVEPVNKIVDDPYRILPRFQKDVEKEIGRVRHQRWMADNFASPDGTVPMKNSAGETVMVPEEAVALGEKTFDSAFAQFQTNAMETMMNTWKEVRLGGGFPSSFLTNLSGDLWVSYLAHGPKFLLYLNRARNIWKNPNAARLVSKELGITETAAKQLLQKRGVGTGYGQVDIRPQEIGEKTLNVAAEKSLAGKIKADPKKAALETYKTGATLGLNSLYKKFMNWEDRTLKTAHWLAFLDRGMSPEEAFRHTFQVLPDFSNPDRFGRVVRQVLPFGNWLYNMMAISPRMIAQRPGLSRLPYKFAQAQKDQPRVDEPPAYQTASGIAAPLPTIEEGGYGLSFTPREGVFEALSMPLQGLMKGDWQGALSGTHPAAKGAFELATGLDTFRQQMKQKPDFDKPFRAGSRTGRFLEDTLSLEPGSLQADPKQMAWLSDITLPQFAGDPLLLGTDLYDLLRGDNYLAPGSRSPEDAAIIRILNRLFGQRMAITSPFQRELNIVNSDTAKRVQQNAADQKRIQREAEKRLDKAK